MSDDYDPHSHAEYLVDFLRIGAIGFLAIGSLLVIVGYMLGRLT